MNGNLPGTTDEGFLGFGYPYTGFSLAPLMSNLEFVRLGAAFRPFENCCRDCFCDRFRHWEIGANFYAYWRPEANGGISDVRADLFGEHFLGNELDISLNARMSSDLFLLLNYGIFSPSDESFSDDSTRQFIHWSLNWLL